jgi:hypothetical protein
MRWRRDVVNSPDYHTNAAALIVAAAAKSGLLKDVAEVLCAFDKRTDVCCNLNCSACLLLENLVDAFDDHTCLAALTWEGLTSEGVEVPECSKEELAPFMAIPLEQAPASTV